MSELVTITGIDGAGKSTLANAVTEELRSRGYSASYVYGRYLPRLAYPVMEAGRRTILSDTDIEEDYTSHQESKGELFSNPAVRFLYESLIMVDYAPQLVARLLPALVSSDFVICDRYIYDTFLTDFKGTIVKTPEEAIKKYDRYSRLVPSPEYMFYLQIPVSIAYERKDDTPAEEYLEDRKEFYEVFSEYFGMTTIDGTDPVEDLVDDVVDRILK